MDFCFYLITDRTLAERGRGLEHVLERAVEAGVKGVLLREKDLPDGELMSLALRVRDLTARHGVKLLISGRPDIAVSVGADGVHLGAGMSTADARRVVGDMRYVAVSTHSLTEAKEAEDAGADFITFGPVYYTASKAVYGPPTGVDALREVCGALHIPVFALGGITTENAMEAMHSGAYGLAVISAVIGADDPAAAVRGIINSIRTYKLGRVV